MNRISGRTSPDDICRDADRKRQHVRRNHRQIK